MTHIVDLLVVNDPVLDATAFNQNWNASDQKRYLINQMARKVVTPVLRAWARGQKHYENRNAGRRDQEYFGESGLIFFHQWKRGAETEKASDWLKAIEAEWRNLLSVDSPQAFAVLVGYSLRLTGNAVSVSQKHSFLKVSSLKEWVALEAVAEDFGKVNWGFSSAQGWTVWKNIQPGSAVWNANQSFIQAAKLNAKYGQSKPIAKPKPKVL